MKVTLLHPPPIGNEELLTEIRYIPLGITSIAGYIRERGYDVQLIDSEAMKYSQEDIIKRISEFGPDVIGITSTTVIINNAFSLAKKIKELNPDIKIVLGGIHATSATEHALSTDYIDVAVIGEGEITFEALLEDFNKKKDFRKELGIAYKKNGKVIINPPRPLISNIDILPFPAYDLLAIEKYSGPYSKRKPFINMVRSRGCPYSCIFCGVNKIFGRTYRVQSPGRTIDEIEYLIKEFGIKEISFKDSEFTINKKNLSNLCDILIEKKYDLKWYCNGRVNNVDFELLKKMHKAGCYSITYGIEAGTQEILNSLKKGITIEQAKKAVAETKEAGIQVVTNFMVGNPGEELESIDCTIKLLKEMNPDYGYFGFLTPFPGTELRKMAKENNWLFDDSMEAVMYENLSMNATHMPTPILKKQLNRVYRAFYFGPKYILKRIAGLNLHNIKKNWKGFLAILKNTINLEIQSSEKKK